MSPQLYGDSNLKEPNVSGQFYPGDPKELSRAVELFLSSAPVKPRAKVKILIAPHAGYAYSGAVAGYSYKAVAQEHFSTIILIGPSHFYDFEGISVWKEGGFKTPLGEIDVDREFAGALLNADGRFAFRPEVFEREHSLEVQMPFLQKTFSGFKIVPILMGRPDYKICQSLAAALDRLIAEREDVLIVVSTDMSHYHPGTFARAMDHKTLAIIRAVDPEGLWNQCLLRESELCGFTSAVTGLLYARARGIKTAEILNYANSGDVTGDTSRVVGYSSVVFTQNGASSSEKNSDQNENEALTPAHKKRLLEIAADTIKTYTEQGARLSVEETDPRLQKEEGAFVTIRKQGQLRGCIGRILGEGTLYLTVRDMAIAAASQDPRFPALTKDELKDIDVEISVLSVPETITDVNQIQMGVHGVIVGRGLNRGLFLPQVATETGWTREQFLSELCVEKAGLPADCWKEPGTRLEVFRAEVFSEDMLNK